MKNTAAKPKQADAAPIKRNVGQIRRVHLKYKLKLFIALMLQTKGMEHPMKLHFVLRENRMTLCKKYLHRFQFNYSVDSIKRTVLLKVLLLKKTSKNLY